MAKLIHFVNEHENKEFVVIFTSDKPDTSEFATGGYVEKRSVEIVGDVTLFPIERALIDEATAF